MISFHFDYLALCRMAMRNGYRAFRDVEHIRKIRNQCFVCFSLDRLRIQPDLKQVGDTSGYRISPGIRLNLHRQPNTTRYFTTP